MNTPTDINPAGIQNTPQEERKPNRRERRFEKQAPRKGGNRKNTPGRHTQQRVAITTPILFKGKEVGREETGYARTIKHTPVETKVRSFVAAVREKLFSRKDSTTDKRKPEGAL